MIRVIAILFVAVVIISSLCVKFSEAGRGGYNFPNPQLGRCFASCDRKYTPYTKKHQRCIRECYIIYGN